MNPHPTAQTRAPRQTTHFVDTFLDDVKQGAVIGTSNRSGIIRRGIDVEGVIGIDHGALRIRPMIRQSWGRSFVGYGPYDRRNGLMFATFLLNGHNTSQSEALPERLSARLLRWLQGHGDRRWGLLRRLLQWLRYRRKRYLFHKVRSWHRMASGSIEPLDENMAVGWFPSEHPGDPADGGNLFVMHAALGDNGELWLRSGPTMLSIAQGIQNVPMCYLTVLRDVGAAYYLASVPGANGAGPYPRFRPCAIDATSTDPEVYAGIHQAALGQIGFRTDTRVYGTQVDEVPSVGEWFGTAHAADLLTGSGSLGDRDADRGSRWTTMIGDFVRGRGERARPRIGTSPCSPRSDRRVSCTPSPAPTTVAGRSGSSGGTETSTTTVESRSKQASPES